MAALALYDSPQLPCPRPSLLQVAIEIGPGFTLGDLLKLELHKYEDEVVEIVDRSQKEEKLEQAGGAPTSGQGRGRLRRPCCERWEGSSA